MNIKRLKDLREDKDLKQEDIAKILGIKQQNYSRYEIGIILMPIDRLEKLAIFYNTSIDYIIGLTNMKEPYPRIKKMSKVNNNLTQDK